MDNTFLQAQLMSALQSAQISASAALLQSAVLQACLAYSQYEPALRRVGDAQVVTAAASGQTQLETVGGLFRPGDAIFVDYAGASEQVATVSGFAPLAAQGADASAGAGAALSTVTVSAPLSQSVPEGAILSWNIAPPAKRGLQFPAGRDTAGLPLDFVRVDQDSFDLAIGQRSTIRQGGGFYDASYGDAMNLSGSGIGQSANFGSGWGAGSPIVGNPLNNPNGMGGQASASGGETVYRFLLQARPLLTVTPVPQTAVTLDFWYWGTHVPASLPASALPAVLAYARYAALSALATAAGATGMDRKIGDVTYNGSRNAKELLALASAALDEFERYTRFKPYAVSG